MIKVIQKSRLYLNKKKGFLQIDLAFAILAFFTIFIMVYSLNKGYDDSINQRYKINSLNMDARDICFLLISSPGSPSNWENDFNSTDYFGFRNVNNLYLNSAKMSQFNNTNYFDILDMMNLTEYVNLKLIGIDTGTVYLDFGTNVSGEPIDTGNYVCFSNYNSEVVQLTVEVWK